MVVKNSNLVTKGDLIDATEKILEGMQKMFDNQDKKNDEKFATKEDLKRETGFVRDDINGLKAEFSSTPSRNEFEKLKSKVDHHLTA